MTIPDVQPKGYRIRSADRIQMQRVDWLWEPYLALGNPALVQGYPGQGKSQVLLDIAARLTRGDVMPDGTQGIEGAGLWVTEEDAAESVLVPRLDAANACVERVKIMDRGDATFSLPSGRSVLHEIIEQTNQELCVPIRLIVLDPVTEYMDKKLRINDAHDFRSVLSACGDIAEHFGLTVVCVNHVNKSGGKDDTRTAMERGAGSLSGGAGRVRMQIHCGPALDVDGDEGRYIFAPVKNNYGPLGDALRYEIVDVVLPICLCRDNPRGLHDCPGVRTSRIWWHGASAHRADAVARTRTPEERDASTRAQAWLLAELQTEPKEWRVLVERGCGAGHSASTLRTARANLQDAGLVGKTYSPGEGNRGTLWHRCSDPTANGP